MNDLAVMHIFFCLDDSLGRYVNGYINYVHFKVNVALNDTNISFNISGHSGRFINNQKRSSTVNNSINYQIFCINGHVLLKYLNCWLYQINVSVVLLKSRKILVFLQFFLCHFA